MFNPPSSGQREAGRSRTLRRQQTRTTIHYIGVWKPEPPARRLRSGQAVLGMSDSDIAVWQSSLQCVQFRNGDLVALEVKLL